MTKQATSKLYKHPKASTLYLTIPSDVVKDSSFPFRQGDVIIVQIDTELLDEAIVILRKKE
jgi:hypothetical protein